jgi:hypothetical protein
MVVESVWHPASEEAIDEFEPVQADAIMQEKEAVLGW